MIGASPDENVAMVVRQSQVGDAAAVVGKSGAEKVMRLIGLAFEMEGSD